MEPEQNTAARQKGERTLHISGSTTLLGLIGSPVEHSKSPQMYNHCFQKFGLDYAYLAFDVGPDKVEAAVRAIRTLNLRGANITMPCKAAVIPFLDNITPAAKAIGAVNTVVNDGGVLTGHNTDGLGYTQNLRRHGVNVSGKHIVLLGGGGAGSAIAVQAALEGAAEILVFNRKDSFWPRVEAAMQAAKNAAPACKITLQDLDDREALQEAIASADILSNATRVGMAPLENESSIDPSFFRPDLVVTDVVYAPPRTKMLRDAETAGCKTCDGLGMLLCQGAEAFRLYSGKDMPIEEIRALLYS